MFLHKCLFGKQCNVNKQFASIIFGGDRTKCRAERICGADLNGDNLWIYRA